MPLGLTVTTPGARGAAARPDVIAALRQRLSGGWGDVASDDRVANDRLVSS